MAASDFVSCFAGKPVSHLVAGRTIAFRPVTGKRLFQLRAFVGPIGTALSGLFFEQKNDQGIKTIETVTGESMRDGTPLFNRKTDVDAILPELAKLREDTRTKSISLLLDTVLSSENAPIIGDILVESMRDHFAGHAITGKELIDETELPALVEMIVGAALANKGVLGPLAGMMKDRMGSVVARIGATTAAKSPEPASPAVPHG